MTRLHIHVHTRHRVLTYDTDFKESEHPRRPDGEFAPAGSGATGTGKKAQTKVAKAPAQVAWTKHGGGAFTAEEHARLKAMKIPPAWTEIKLSPDPKAALQVVGKDAKGRAQYRYSAEHSERAAAEKFARLKAFNGVAAAIVNSAKDDMFNRKLTQPQRDAAAVIKLIAATGFRIGSDKDTKADTKATGASTLTKEQVRVSKGGEVSFDFIGKKGVRITKKVTDPEIAKYVNARLKESDGKLFDVPPSVIRSYLKSRGGAAFKVKDFRTWNGTNEALKALKDMPEPTNKKEFAKMRLAVGKRVAEHLGNTPTIALAAYIDPAVFAKWSHLQ